MRVVQIRYRLEGVPCPPPSPPLGHVTLFKRTRNITNTPNGATPTGCTLLGSCPPPVTTGVNLHVYPLIRAGICFSFFFFFSPFPSCFFFPLFTRVAFFPFPFSFSSFVPLVFLFVRWFDAVVESSAS